MYLAHYDTDGNVLGFYIQGMHAETPKPVIEITEEQHTEFFTKGQNHKVLNGTFIYVEPPAPVLQVVTPALNQDIADLWEAILAISADKGGK